LNAEQVIDQFRATGALLEGHFQLSSGLHSTVYLQCALVLQFPERAAALGRALAAKFQGQGIQLVASPAIGGIVIGHEVARSLGARFVWTEREAGHMTLRRGFTIAPGEKTLIVEDVITTGGSTRETIEAVRKAGADVIGAASIIDRSGGAADVGVPLTSLASLRVLSVESSACDACKLDEPVVKPGSRKAAP
jgi:orotate phosphoribosyltransferase